MFAAPAAPSLGRCAWGHTNREVLMNVQVILIVALVVILVVLVALRGKSKPGSGGSGT